MNAPNPVDDLRGTIREFGETLEWWFGNYTMPQGYARARKSVALLSDALARLGTRDRGGVRESLSAKLATISNALAAFEGVVGEDPAAYHGNSGGFSTHDIISRGLPGKLFVAAAGARRQAKAVHDSAFSAMQRATKANVREMRAALDDAAIDLRDANEALEALRESCAFPSVVNEADFVEAERLTSELHNAGKLGGARNQALATHMACEQGATVSPGTAALFVVYEQSESQLYELRWNRYLARQGGD